VSDVRALLPAAAPPPPGPPLARGQGGPGGSEALDAWESALFHARNLQRCVEDLGAAMYPPQVLACPRRKGAPAGAPTPKHARSPSAQPHPTRTQCNPARSPPPLPPPPQDLDEVRSAAEAAATTAELMLDECPAPDALGQDLGRLGDALQAAAARVERVLAAGAAENGAADD
jgi:hypothetical protein